MANIPEQLKKTLDQLSVKQLRQVAVYARALRPKSAERRTIKTITRQKPARQRELSGTRLGQLILRIEEQADIGLPKDFASQLDHYAYGTAKRTL